MGDMSNGGPGYGGYGRGPQQPRAGSNTSYGYGEFEPPMRMPWNPYAGGGGMNPFGRPGPGTFQQGNGPSYSYNNAPPPQAGMPPPGSFSAGVAALGRGDPNAQNMINQAAGLPVQSGGAYGLDAMKNFATQQNAGPPPPPPTGTYSSQGPAPQPRSGTGFTPTFDPLRDEGWSQQLTPNQRLMMESGRGQRGFWQGPTSPFGMQGPGGNPWGPGMNPYALGNYGQRRAVDQGYMRSLSSPHQGGTNMNGMPK